MNHFSPNQIKSHFTFKLKFGGKCVTGIKQFQSCHANTQHIQIVLTV